MFSSVKRLTFLSYIIFFAAIALPNAVKSRKSLKTHAPFENGFYYVTLVSLAVEKLYTYLPTLRCNYVQFESDLKQNEKRKAKEILNCFYLYKHRTMNYFLKPRHGAHRVFLLL